MFTGIIEEMGTITELQRGAEPSGGARMVIRARQVLSGKAKLREGESIAVNGVCLTTREIKPRTFATDLSPETLERSNLKALQAGARVNLERPMTPSSRFGGHIVQGHVDGVGKLVALDPLPDGNYWLSVDIPAELERYIVSKGSIALNGISLTVARLDGLRVGVAIIPYTYEQTNLADLKPGDPINIECDVLAKYVEKLLPPSATSSTARQRAEKQSSLTLERLIAEGF
ncbi:MAG: riboflavin synthase [Acidobacteria bacterium]|nr:riboflavin synthase [Acidobacteriota bacterium]